MVLVARKGKRASLVNLESREIEDKLEKRQDKVLMANKENWDLEESGALREALVCLDLMAKLENWGLMVLLETVESQVLTDVGDQKAALDLTEGQERGELLASLVRMERMATREIQDEEESKETKGKWAKMGHLGFLVKLVYRVPEGKMVSLVRLVLMGYQALKEEVEKQGQLAEEVPAVAMEMRAQAAFPAKREKLVSLDCLAAVGHKAMLGYLEKTVKRVKKEMPDHLGRRDTQEKWVSLVQLEVKDREESQEQWAKKERTVCLGFLVIRAQGVLEENQA